MTTKHAVAVPDRASRGVRGRATAIQTRQTEGRDPILVTEVRRGEVKVFPVEDLESLLIDERYQRAENRTHVNQMVATLNAGGMIPDPIKVVVRHDGAYFIVDGQQRWWAHWVAQKPIAAQLYHLDSGVDALSVERAMFTAFNNFVRPSASVRVSSWPGPSGNLMRYLNEAEESPIRTEVGFLGGSTRYPSASLLKGVLAALGSYPRGRVEELLGSLDLVIRNCRDYDDIKRRAVLYAAVLKSVFENRQRINWLVARALGMVCGKKWRGRDPYTPSAAEGHRLAQANWDAYAPHAREEIIAILMAEIEKRWKA